jgi:16S rRNA (cytosine1402-N4)-methyltransferase
MTHHIPVLQDDMVNAVMTDPDGTYLDATFGRGGHARALLRQLSPKATLLVLDRDPDA